jgi:hypothetical protein
VLFPSRLSVISYAMIQPRIASHENEGKYLVGAIGNSSHEGSRMFSHFRCSFLFSIHSRNKNVYHLTNFNPLAQDVNETERQRGGNKSSFGVRGRFLSCLILPMHPVVPLLCSDSLPYQENAPTPPSHPSSTIQ